MLAILVIGGILAVAPAWGPFFLSDDVAFFTAPILGVVVAAPAFAALCLLRTMAPRGPVMRSRKQVMFEVKFVSAIFLAFIFGIIVLWFVS